MLNAHALPAALPAALLAAVALAGPAPARAQVLIDATDPNGIVEIASGYGEALLEADDAGDPMITGKIGHTNYIVFFYGCTDNADCSNLQFMSSYTNVDGVDLDLVNAWNAERRFGKAFLDGDGDPVIEMNVNLWSGVSPNNLNDTFDWWRLVLENFEDHIGFVPAEPASTDAAKTPGGGSTVKVNR